MATTVRVPISLDEQIIGYHSLALMIIGTLLNFLTFVILCRKKFRNTRARPTLHYMRAVAIFDILMLYGWNLDHYLSSIHRIRILGQSIFSCRFFSFLSYFCPQTSAWLRVWISFDRFLSMHYLQRTCFNQSNNVIIIITTTVTVLILLNAHFFIFVCFHRSNGTISALSWLYNIYPMWDYIHLVVYNFLPFIFMVIFNSGVIYHLIRVQRTTMVHQTAINHRAISITLVITTFLFLLMTVPATVAFAFFSNSNIVILRVLDALLYTHHILGFPIYLLTFDEFRRECIAFIKFTPQVQVVPTAANVVIN